MNRIDLKDVEAAEGPPTGASLSAEGAARRVAMQDMLTAEVVRVHRARDRRRRAAASALLVAAGVGVITAPFALRSRTRSGTDVTSAGFQATEPSDSRPAIASTDVRDPHAPSTTVAPGSPASRGVVRIAVVTDDPATLARYAAAANRSAIAGLVHAVDDAGLVAMLRALDRPAGLITVADAPPRLSRDVTDNARLGPGREPSSQAHPTRDQGWQPSLAGNGASQT